MRERERERERDRAARKMIVKNASNAARRGLVEGDSCS